MSIPRNNRGLPEATLPHVMLIADYYFQKHQKLDENNFWLLKLTWDKKNLQISITIFFALLFFNFSSFLLL